MKKYALRISSAAVIAGLVASASVSESLRAGTLEWPRFRGPDGSGLGDGKLPDPITEKSILWKVELPGAGHSSPVITGDRIFLTVNPEKTGNHVLLSLKTEDGSEVWRKEFQSENFRQHADNSYASSTPALDDERVFVSWMSPEGSGLAALSQEDGRELWRQDLGPFISQHGPGVSPIVADGLVIIDFDPDQPGSFLAAFDAKTGSEKWRWKHQGNKHSSSTPCILETKSGGKQVITVGNAMGVTGVDLATGKVAWQLPDAMPLRCVASPFLTDDGLVIAQCGQGATDSVVKAVRIADDGKSAQVAYEIVRVGGYVPTAIAVGKHLVLWKENGFVTCVGVEGGQQLWSERVPGNYYGSPVAVGNTLCNVTKRGDLVVVDVGEGLRELARIPLGEGSHATPAISGNRLYCRTFTHLIAIGN
ncbi:MAG: PQQ-binding-like beta-propeller repeat protein [Chthoniobacteraceae bacterium]